MTHPNMHVAWSGSRRVWGMLTHTCSPSCHVPVSPGGRPSRAPLPGSLLLCRARWHCRETADSHEAAHTGESRKPKTPRGAQEAASVPAPSGLPAPLGVVQAALQAVPAVAAGRADGVPQHQPWRSALAFCSERVTCGCPDSHHRSRGARFHTEHLTSICFLTHVLMNLTCKTPKINQKMFYIISSYILEAASDGSQEEPDEFKEISFLIAMPSFFIL